MMVTPSSPFVCAPRISRERFISVLREAGSPWIGQAGELYDLIAGQGHDPAIWLAICGREHYYGTVRDSVLWRSKTRSWTNARSVRLPGLWHEIIVDPVRGGPYVRYLSVRDSLRDGIYRIDDPGYVYQRRRARSIAEVLGIWTESDPAGYIAYAVERINAWQGGTPYDAIFPRLVDIRPQLARREPSSGAGPFERLALSKKRGLTVHYSGPAVDDRRRTLQVLQAEARYHVGKDWSGPGEPILRGDGLMYHLALGEEGTLYLCRDLESMLWHAADRWWNRHALAVHLTMGGSQRATPAQLTALRELADRWRGWSGTTVEQVVGHGEVSATSCPGSLMDDFVLPYRRGALSVAQGKYFTETGHYVGGGFWEFWRTHGGLPIFGYPLSEELQEPVADGTVRTVQYFERAVFEWHPELPVPYQVLLRRLGAEALERRRVV